MSNSEELEKAVEGLRCEIGRCSSRFSNECKLYHQWDLGLTVAAIIFTLLTAVTGTLEDGKLLPGNSQKILTGVFGAIAVAIQSGVTKFPVQERAKSYRKLRNEMFILQRELDVIETDEGLKTVRGQYAKVLRDEMEMP